MSFISDVSETIAKVLVGDGAQIGQPIACRRCAAETQDESPLLHHLLGAGILVGKGRHHCGLLRHVCFCWLHDLPYLVGDLCFHRIRFIVRVQESRQ